MLECLATPGRSRLETLQERPVWITLWISCPIDDRSGVEQELGSAGLSDDLIADSDYDVAGGGADVDAVVGVAQVRVDGVVFFKPAVEGDVSEVDVVGQVGVTRLRVIAADLARRDLTADP